MMVSGSSRQEALRRGPTERYRPVGGACHGGLAIESEQQECRGGGLVTTAMNGLTAAVRR
jgi:hypothetical protein